MPATLQIPLGLTGVTPLTCDLFPENSDTAAASGVALTEATNRKGIYTASVSVTGWHTIKLYVSAAYFPAVFAAQIPSSGTITAVSEAGVGRADNRDGEEIPTAAQNAAATAAQITTDHGSGSYIRNTEPDNAGISANASALTTILARIGAFTGSGVNTVLGFLKAIASKTATLPSDIGGTFDPAADSLEAIADVGGGLTQQNIDDIAAGSAARVVATLGGVAGSASTDEVRPGGRLPITRGDDYYTEDGFPISVVIENVENDLAVESLTLYLYRAGVRVEESTTNITIAANVLTALVDMGRAKTSQLQAGDGRWSAQISLASGHYREPVTGPMLVTERVGPIP